VNSTSGNVQVAFGVFSYAGNLTVNVVGDAYIAGDLPALVASLQRQLDGLGAALVASEPISPAVLSSPDR
jgi:hypothetical protein